jgi:superfamily II DNA or RNA helicase
MTKRLFNRKQKLAVELVTGRTGDADHIEPHSKGGKTSVENCQLISKKTNSQKGSFMFEPRLWQQEFFEKWDNRTPNRPFMLIAIPGGGKTMAALDVCRRWIAGASDRRILIIVPTDNLREQWRDEAVNFGLDLHTKEFGANFKHGFQGGVTTYSFVANNSALIRKICHVSPTIVVFDEIHHCADESHFGKGILEGCELAKERLLMSGTPWKSDGRPIPYVKYDGNGYAVGDFSYDYPRALNDDVVRYLVFNHSKGIIKSDLTGEEEVVSQDISEQEAQSRLRNLLQADGDFVAEMITCAHRKLLEVRKQIPDAAAMAACIDVDHAQRIAAVIRRITKCEPSIIVSDQDIENDTVKEFRNSRTEWIVSVRKVCEGTDIKRLQVLCYLTNTTSELFFRQLIGRVSRFRNIEDREAYVYLPADPRLIRCAQNIMAAQVQALREQNEIESRELKEREQGEFNFDSYSTIHDGTDIVFIGSEKVSRAEAELVQRIAEDMGLTHQQVLRIMELTGRRMPQDAAPELRTPVEVHKEDRMDKLRAKCNKAAFRLSIILDCEVSRVHARFPKQKDMTEEQLDKKHRTLCEEYESAKRRLG